MSAGGRRHLSDSKDGLARASARPGLVGVSALAVLVSLGPLSRSARAQELAGGTDQPRFAVVDLSNPANNEKIVASVEREFQRLRKNAQLIDDVAMRRLLMTGEGPSAAATRLLKESEDHKTAGDCAGAIERAQQAELIALSSVPVDDERELLTSLYAVMVVCEDQRGRAAERTTAAQRLRALVSLPPGEMPPEIWEKHVATATLGPASTEILIDSEPANAQISVDFHGVGVTPHTLKVAPGTHTIELQKDGYRKSFRWFTVGTQPIRTAFRLTERTHDRLDQARATLNVLRKAEGNQRTLPLARLAQFARTDTLVALSVSGDRVRIWFFDAERGALSSEVIDSRFDPATGRVAALADRGAPSGAKKSGPNLSAPAPTAASGGANLSTPAPAKADEKIQDALPEAQSTQELAQYRRRAKAPTPWWSWAIAGLIGGALLVYIYGDQPKTKSTLGVEARWSPPNP